MKDTSLRDKLISNPLIYIVFNAQEEGTFVYPGMIIIDPNNNQILLSASFETYSLNGDNSKM